MSKNKSKNKSALATKILCIVLALLMVGSFITYLLYAIAGIL